MRNMLGFVEDENRVLVMHENDEWVVTLLRELPSPR